MKRKNIAIIVHNLSEGGAERAAANLSRDLSEKYNVFLFLFDESKITYPYCGTVVGLSSKPVSNIFLRVIHVLSRIRKVKKYKKQYDISCAISFMPSENLTNVLSRRGEKVIISVRNIMSDVITSKLEKKIISWCGKKADLTVSLSDGVRNDLIKNFGYKSCKVSTIYNSCDYSWFYKENQDIVELEKNFDFSGPTIVTVGRLTHQKGQWHLLRAMKPVINRFPNCQLVIFGEGSLYEELILYAKKLGIEKNVHLFGFVKNHHAFLRKCDLFVFPSLFEGLGNVVLEALACGLPVISTNCKYGPSEILDDCICCDDSKITYGKYGVLVPSFSKTPFSLQEMNNEAADIFLSEAIISMLSDKELLLYYREKALSRIKDFLPVNIMEKWEKIIENEYN